MADAIEWTNASPDDIVWCFPDNRVKWGSQLTVKENQVAIFYRDGKALDTFIAGRHKLTTSSMPRMVGWLQKKIEGDIFEATCIFVSCSQFQGKFGGRGQTSDLAPLMFHGNFWFRIKEPKIFTNEVVGSQNAFTTAEVNDYLRWFMNEQIIDEFAHYDMQAVFTQLDETSLKVKTNVRMNFERLGVELVDIKFEGMDTTEQYRERLFWLKTGKVEGSDLAGMETMKRAAESLGKSPGAGFGAGMGFMGAVSGNVSDGQQSGQAGKSPDVSRVLERYASLTYWERMALKQEYNLVVSLHEKGIQVESEGTVTDFETRYEIPTKGRVRIIPVCTKCMISPSSREVTVKELERETRAEFKVRPIEIGPAELTIEFHFVSVDGPIELLGKERVTVTVQEKPYELKIGNRTIKVSAKVPAVVSALGGFSTFVSFVLSLMGINLQTGALTASATIGSGAGGVLMLGYGALLFLKSVKPLMRIVPIKLT